VPLSLMGLAGWLPFGVDGYLNTPDSGRARGFGD